MLSAVEQALWANAVQRDCILAGGDDLEAALAAAEYIVATQPVPQSISAPFAHDIHNPQAQSVLNRSLKAVKGLSAAARKDLAAALKGNSSGEAIVSFIGKYRLQLAKLLTSTQLAALLEGASEVAAKVPTLATFPGAVAPPPTLEPQEAVALVERLEKTKDAAERARIIADLPPEQQEYARQAVVAKEAHAGTPPPRWGPPAPPEDEPDGVHFPTIDAAVKNLAERNVLDRQRYDALDAAARAKAFTVANVQATETLEKIRGSLAENVKEGADYEAWREKVLAEVDEGTFLGDAHNETVFRTNVQTAFSDGQAAVLEHPLVRSGFPYATYDSIADDRRRENHGRLEHLGIQGTNIYRIDDPVFQTFRPNWDYNCRCSWSPITVRQAAERGIKEAAEWLRTGQEPAEKAFVPMPDFRPPEGFQRSVAGAPLSIRLSMESLEAFAFDLNDRHGNATAKGKGTWITIGGHEEGGKKHAGGFPILIDDNGRIIGGHAPAGLLGKKVSEAKGHFDEMKSRAEAQQTTREHFVKRAKKLGYSPEDLDWFSKRERKTHEEVRSRLAECLKHARSVHAHYNDGERLSRSLRAFKGNDFTYLGHWDETTSSLMEQFPDVLGDDERTAMERLYDLVNAGPPPVMSMKESYQRAIDEMEAEGPQKKPSKRRKEEAEEPIPFSLEKEQEDEDATPPDPEAVKRIAALVNMMMKAKRGVALSHHAPPGGATVGGKFYLGGEFIPAGVMANATPEERAAVGGHSNPEAELPPDLDLAEGLAAVRGMRQRLANMVKVAKDKLAPLILKLGDLGPSVIPNAYDHARNALMATAVPGVPVNDIALGLSGVIAWAWKKAKEMKKGKEKGEDAAAMSLEDEDRVKAILEATAVLYEMLGLPEGTPPPTEEAVRAGLEQKRDDASLSTDAQGHEHRGKGPGGGQFVGKENAHAAWKAETERLEQEHAGATQKHEAEHAAWVNRGLERNKQMMAIASTDFVAEADGPAEQSLIGKAPLTIGTYKAIEDTPEGREQYRRAAADFAGQYVAAWQGAYGKDGALIRSLSEAGATEKDLARLAMLGERGKAAVEKAAQKWQQAIDRHVEHKAKQDELGSEPEEPQPPDEPDDLDADDPDVTPLEREANAAAWKQYEKDQASYESAYEAWETAHEKWQERSEKLEERDNELSDRADEILTAVDEVWAEHKTDIEEAVTKISDRLYDKLQEEDEADAEPEEPEEPDYPDEPEEEEEEEPEEEEPDEE